MDKTITIAQGRKKQDDVAVVAVFSCCCRWFSSMRADDSLLFSIVPPGPTSRASPPERGRTFCKIIELLIWSNFPLAHILSKLRRNP